MNIETRIDGLDDDDVVRVKTLRRWLHEEPRPAPEPASKRLRALPGGENTRTEEIIPERVYRPEEAARLLGIQIGRAHV